MVNTCKRFQMCVFSDVQQVSAAYACRFTTLDLAADNFGSFEASAAGMDVVFTADILANARCSVSRGI